MWGQTLVIAGFAVVTAGQVLAHSGGLDANGCHHDRKRGGYHCHRAATPLFTPPKVTQPQRRKVKPALPLLQTPDGQLPATAETKIQRAIREVQQGLMSLGYFDGPVTGTIGPKTKKAIRDFEAAFSLPLTGRVTPELLRRLDVAF